MVNRGSTPRRPLYVNYGRIGTMPEPESTPEEIERMRLRARNAVYAYMDWPLDTTTPGVEDVETAILDLVCSLHHFWDSLGDERCCDEWDTVVNSAESHYEAEAFGTGPYAEGWSS